MSDAGTKKMLRRYEEMADTPSFFSSYFTARPENFHTSESIEIDIERSGREVAIAVTDISANGHENKKTLITNKMWTPPIFKERVTVTSFDMIKRQAGQDPFQAPDYQANVTMAVLKETAAVTKKVRRSIELMASQVLQTGQLTLVDGAGANRFLLDFKPKASHIVTAGTDWGTGTEDKIADIEGLAEQLVVDGKDIPNKLAFGRVAWQEFLADPAIQALLDNRRMDIGQVTRPRRDRNGGNFHGTISIGSFEFELWTYRGRYDHPQTGTPTPYLVDDLVVMTSTDARYDLSFGDIPTIPGAPNNALQYVPQRLSLPNSGMDMIVRAWFSEDGTHLNASVGSRPLTIPTAIDTIGVLNTVA